MRPATSTRLVHLARKRTFSFSLRRRNDAAPPPPPPLNAKKPPPSPHAQFYTELLPAMAPIALLGSAIYLGLELLRSNLAHEKHCDEARARATALEAEIDALLLAQNSKPADDTTITAGASPSANGATRSWWKFF